MPPTLNVQYFNLNIIFKAVHINILIHTVGLLRPEDDDGKNDLLVGYLVEYLTW